jgi:hypothetical protein
VEYLHLNQDRHMQAEPHEALSPGRRSSSAQRTAAMHNLVLVAVEQVHGRLGRRDARRGTMGAIDTICQARRRPRTPRAYGSATVLTDKITPAFTLSVGAVVCQGSCRSVSSVVWQSDSTTSATPTDQLP